MVFLGIIFCAFAILQIVLFFKVWGMCNNVSRIRQSMKEASGKYGINNDLLRLYLAAGNKDGAAQYVIEHIQNGLKSLDEDNFLVIADDGTIRYSYNINADSLDEYVNNLLKYVRDYSFIIGFDLPKHLTDKQSALKWVYEQRKNSSREPLLV